MRKALGGATQNLNVVNKLGRCRNTLIRAMRSFEEEKKTETKEYKMLAAMKTQSVGKWGLVTPVTPGSGPNPQLSVSPPEEKAEAHGVGGGGKLSGSPVSEGYLDSGPRKRKRDEADLLV